MSDCAVQEKQLLRPEGDMLIMLLLTGTTCFPVVKSNFTII
jgi:hypothetical protein